ncbi:RNA-directed DNA polymerase, eukaryota, reverse transcriptase zinc-binding domain protein [Tanacetum coccineum]
MKVTCSRIFDAPLALTHVGCTKRERTQEEISVKVNAKKGVSSGVEENLNGDGGWQDVRKYNRSGASTSNNVDQSFNNGYGFGYRGGYNVRGRGGRGGMNGRGGLSGGRGSLYQKENNEGVGMKFVLVRNVGKRVDNVQVMEGEGSGNRANKGKNVDNAKSEAVKKTYEKKPVTVKNSFDALAEDSIDESEKKRWSVDLIKYYADKCEAKARQNLIAGLKWRIAKLKQNIDYRNTYVSKVANEEAQKQCVALMKTDGITRNQAFGKIYDETYRSELIKINDMRLEQQRAKVELFFYSEGVLSNAVRETWTDDMIEQYETLMGEKVDKMMKEDLQEGFVQSMDEEVAEDTSDSAMFMSRDEVQNVMEDNDILMQGNFASTSSVLRKKFVNKVCNEVFRDWNWVFNSVDSRKGCRIAVGWDPNVISSQLLSHTSQVMHFLIRRVGDPRDIYISFIYGENNVKERRDLWKNLREHNSIAGCSPWVLLGDFNVILYYNENSNGINVQSFGVHEFRDCVDNLSLEDIKLTGLFFTWIQVRRDPSKGVLKKLDRVMGNGHFVSDFSNSFANFLPFASSDHSPAVLVMPEVKGKSNKAFRFMNFLADKDDFVDVVRQHWFVPVKGFNMYVLAKRLKALKKHMRSFNKKNGNVCEKVMRLKVELARVQEELSRDPSNVELRDEELFYADAYKKAARDEELLLKQKSKIQWLKEGDFNTAFSIIWLRAELLKIELRLFMMMWEMLSMEVKLDAGTALDLIKHVSDCEIKAALFDIEDNKASGPDGYSSKFFKAAWSVVGRDTCLAIREFFINGKLLEFMRGYSWSINKGASRCAFKIDIQKAYDTVNWDFLENVLKCFGFHPVMIRWIMVCLTMASFSVCINGEPHGFFKAGRGLRQGDPISPYLFTLVMEVLNLMVIRQVKAEKRFKYHWGCKELKITSLCFADDLLMLCHGDLISASVLRRGLDEFCVSSGLRPSMSKSEAFFRNVPDEVIADINLVMPFKIGVLPIKYLGVPMMSKRLTSKDCVTPPKWVTAE